jgi:hypothetical protein
MISCTQDHPPPYPTKIGGTTSTMTGSATYGVAFDPTHIRGRVIVESHAVTIGTITLTAS